MALKLTDLDYYRVFAGGVEFSKHRSQKEAIEGSSRAIDLHPGVEPEIKQPVVRVSPKTVQGGTWPETTPPPEEPEPTKPEPPTDGELVRYLHSVTAPGRDPEGNRLLFGGAAIAVRDGVAHIVGHDHEQTIGVLRMPRDGGEATFEVPLRDVTDGALASMSANISKTVIGGVREWNGRVFVNGYVYYDASNRQRECLGWATPGFPFNGWHAIPTPTGRQRALAGHMVEIPEPWASRIGFPMMTGLSGVAIVGNSSGGPSSHAFDPDDLSRESVPLVFYENDRHFFDGDKQTYNQTSRPVVRFIKDDWLCHVGTHGIGSVYYGKPGQDGNPLDPVRGTGKGYHAEDYVLRIWRYRMSDVMRVVGGEVAPHEIPVFTEDITDAVPRAKFVISGDFDNETSLLYLVPQFGSSTPTIHVCEVS